jgi:hypothetical protein
MRVNFWQEGIAALNQKISVTGIKNIKTRVADITTIHSDLIY